MTEYLLFLQLLFVLFYGLRFLYEGYIQNLSDKKNQYKFQNHNLKNHKDYLLKQIEEERKSNEELKSKFNEMLELYKKVENELKHKEKIIKKVNTEKNYIFVEKEQLKYQMKNLEQEKEMNRFLKRKSRFF